MARKKKNSKAGQEAQLARAGQTCAVYAPKTLLGRAIDITHDMRRYGYTALRRDAKGREGDPDVAVFLLEQSFFKNPVKSKLMIQLYGVLNKRVPTQIIFVLVYDENQRVRVPSMAELAWYVSHVTNDEWQLFLKQTEEAQADSPLPVEGKTDTEQKVTG